MQTSITFVSKVMVDAFTMNSEWSYVEYLRGMAVGVFSFVFNTPLREIHKIQSKVVDNKHQKIGKYAAFNFMINTYTSRSLYASRFIVNLINFINSVIYLTLYFGVNDDLSRIYPEVPYRYILNPFLASLVAVIPTSIISSFSNAYTDLQTRRYIIAQGKGKRLMPPGQPSVFLEVLRQGGGLLKQNVKKRRFHLYQFVTSWLMLSLFTFIQAETG